MIDWVRRGLLKAVALNGAAAIHDFELAFAGKTDWDRVVATANVNVSPCLIHGIALIAPEAARSPG